MFWMNSRYLKVDRVSHACLAISSLDHSSCSANSSTARLTPFVQLWCEMERKRKVWEGAKERRREAGVTTKPQIRTVVMQVRGTSSPRPRFRAWSTVVSTTISNSQSKDGDSARGATYSIGNFSDTTVWRVVWMERLGYILRLHWTSGCALIMTQHNSSKTIRRNATLDITMAMKFQVVVTSSSTWKQHGRPKR